MLDQDQSDWLRAGGTASALPMPSRAVSAWPLSPPGLTASTEAKVMATEHPQNPGSISPLISGPQSFPTTILIICEGPALPEAWLPSMWVP